MSAFDELKAAAKTVITAEEVKAKGWWAKNWKEVLVWAVILAIGVIVGRLL